MLNVNQILIDGYNLINAVDKLKASLERSLEAARDDLIVHLQGFANNRDKRIVVVFDGTREFASAPSKKGGIRIQYSRPPKNADQVIKDMVGRTRHPRKVLVVSSDQEIKRYARLCGAQTVSSPEFFRMISKEKSRKTVKGSEKPTMSPGEIEEWEQIFDVENFKLPKKRRQK